MSGSSHLRGVVGMAASALLFSVMALLIRYGHEIDFYKTALYRFTVGACLLGTLALFGRIRLDFNNSRVLFLRGLLGGLSVLLFYMSIVKVGIAKGTVLSHTYPVFATIGGAVFLGDRVRPAVWSLLAAAVGGIGLLIGVRSGGWSDPWILLTLLGALFGGLAIVCVKRLTATDSHYSIFLSQCLIGFWIVAVPANLTPVRMGWTGGLLLVAIGLAATAAQLLMTWSFGHVPIATGSLLGMLTPLFNVLFGIALFGERLSPGELAGTALILAACIGVVAWGREPVPARR